MQFRRYASTILAAGAFAVAAFAQTTSTATSVTRQLSFAPVGLAGTEIAQVNVANLASNSSGTAASCTGTISFVNASGIVLGSATSFTITSGQTFSAKMSGTGSGVGGRQVIRGLVQVTVGSSGAPCSLVSSMEIYDNSTGVTHAFLDGGEMSGGGGGFGPGR